MPEDSNNNLILLGHIAGAHGIRGEVLIKPYTEAPENIASYGPLTDESGTSSFAVKIVRLTNKGVVARINGVSDRSAAEALRGTKLFVAREKLPPPDDGEFYYEDLLGLAAYDKDGKQIGTVKAMQNFGAGDLIELTLTGRREAQLVPFNEDTVPEVDIAGGRITIVLPAEIAGEPDEAKEADK